jgi:hypothetical protein
MVVAWLPARFHPEDERLPLGQREIRASAFITAGMVGMFATFGFQRPEGWAFNQRYLLELLPLGALCAAWALDRVPFRWSTAGVGVAAGMGAAGLTLWAMPTVEISRALILALPIVLAGLLFVVAVGGSLGKVLPTAAPWLQRAVPALTAVGFGWAMLVHIAEDVRASRVVRARNKTRAAIISAALPATPAAVFAHWGTKDPLPVLHFEHDIVGADTWVDDGRSARVLSEAMLAQGRTIFVLVWGMPLPLLEQLTNGRNVRLLKGRLTLLEVTPTAPVDSPTAGR